MKKYDNYKNSGVEWLGEIPEHWEEKKFKHIFSEKKKTTNLDLPCGSISFGKVVYKDDEKIPESTKRSYQVLSNGDFLINPLNLNYDLISLRIALADKEVVVSSGYIILKNNLKLNKDYFKWLLHIFDVVYMKTLGSGVRQTLSFTHIANCELVFPPLEEQNKMADFLETKTTKIDQAIAIKQQQIELLKERRQVLIHKAVTRGLNQNVKLKDSGVAWIGEIPEHWEVKKLKYCTNIFRGKFTHRPRNDERLYDGNYPFFQTGDVARAGKFLSEHRQTLNEFGLRVSTLFPRGTIVMTIAANIGDIAILDIDACFPDSIVGFKPMNYLERDFLYNSLLVMKEQFMSSTIKNTQMNLNVDRIGINAIVIPSIEEQKKIVEFIETTTTKIATAISLKEQEIEKLKEYKMSLIDGVVTGKVKVC
jgi:type I restriction enzyme S subunit